MDTIFDTIHLHTQQLFYVNWTISFSLGIYEVFVGHKNFAFGKQPQPFAETETVRINSKPLFLDEDFSLNKYIYIKSKRWPIWYILKDEIFAYLHISSAFWKCYDIIVWFVIDLRSHICCFFQLVYVMPSSSARCSQLPRAIDKVPFYTALKKLRDYLRGDLEKLDDSEVCFPDVELKVVKKEPKQEKVEEDSKSNPPLFGDQQAAMMAPAQMDHGNFPPHPNNPLPGNPNFIHVKQEPAFSPQDYGGQMPGCGQGGNYPRPTTSPPQMFGGQFSQPGYPPQQMAGQGVMGLRKSPHGQAFQGNFQSEMYRQQGFQANQSFKQAMSISSQMNFSQGVQNFQMSGQYAMSMASSWAGQVQVKQEPHDWSSNIPAYSSPISQGNASQTQSGNPLQMLENLSQGLGASSTPPICTSSAYSLSQSPLTSNNNGIQGVHDNFYGNQSYPQGNRLSQTPEHCGNSQLNHGNIPDEVPLPPSQSPIHIPDIIQDLPTTHGSVPPVNQACTAPHPLGNMPPQLSMVKSEPKDFTTDTTCPFSK